MFTPQVRSVPPSRPTLSEGPSQFLLLERAVEDEFRPRMLEELAAAGECGGGNGPGHQAGLPGLQAACRLPGCAFGTVAAPRYRCPVCGGESRPLLDRLGVEPGPICGSLARLLALLGNDAPYQLAATLAGLLLGVKVKATGVWRITQRLGQAAADYDEDLTRYHADIRSQAPTAQAPPCHSAERGRLFAWHASPPQQKGAGRRMPTCCRRQLSKVIFARSRLASCYCPRSESSLRQDAASRAALAGELPGRHR